MTTINTPTYGDDELKSRLKGLTDEQKDKLFEMLKEDKKLRENKNEGNSEKLINSELKYFDTIIHEIETMKENVDKIHNLHESNIFKTTFEFILDGFNFALDDFKYYSDKWHSNKNIKSSDIRTDIQDILKKECTARKGCINQIMIFLSYSRNSIIKNQMNEHGIDVSLLENICSNITKMLNEINMEVIVPTVLMDNFDQNLHDYENGSVWIDRYFPNIDARDYKKGTIFDIISIGYEIKDEKGNIIESKKPTLKFY